MEKSSLLTQEEKEYFMTEAMKEAHKAEAIAEVPIGAIVVLDGKIIGRGHNLREKSQEATAHAEMFAIKEACNAIGSWRLERAQLFVTLEPCPMCSGAMILSRVDEVYFGAYDPKGGTAGSLLNLLEDERFNHRAYVEGGILEDLCGQQLTRFFQEIRAKKKLAKEQAKKLQEDVQKD
ncbi:cytidine/deoxycytidylate deaminase [Enterococcus phoeniculicola]|jgi:tRNA(adenine34) deaminase|uniref:tRNA-specific adenosine deaminase n=1 Tax=Enterococcus phoeniculicola ATCC BAA-412 TaxID=1158610 RepID=R3WQM2_9ENTE|nr:tRNA adenosine(34) deaminase TadA [Enterococcus phoeniculicola]EOL44130.1 cytidine/deoxycytidylate deaminase [Enterococcus phoeniculicola ATCC BAA-412]EOT75232.1 cytidine/deoxycytidylate deaminase [Enterococcus phoeniculicola ATCC BAA-412]OJG69485.1 cytidine/deoxycytidylate deaminase [Enterococcus phoeniculicola]